MMKKLNYKLSGASCLTAGLLFASFEIHAVSPSLSYKLDGKNLTITYTGTLYQSSDAVHWSEVGSASSPYKVEVTDKKLFFCTKGESGGADGQNFTIPLSGTVSLDMVWCPAGTFTMGSPSSELCRDSDETQHNVTISHVFWIGKYEVTQVQYRAVMGSNPSYFKGDNLPVEEVTWYDAMEFCQKLTAHEQAAGRLPMGYEYTLPTEALWEYACRAGTTTAFNNGTNIPTEEQGWEPCPNLDSVAWYGYNSGSTTHPVGQKRPNNWGIYDMHGNVWEWCLDWYSGWEGSYRVLRGGCWRDYAFGCRSACRLHDHPDHDSDGGFRVALSIVQ